MRRCWFRMYSTATKPVIDLAQFEPDKIRNFSIIAHIDHGKSTLADRLLELTGTIPKNKSNKQVMDKLKVERDRGITVKAQTASMIYDYKGSKYLLNLIDTPGHSDFSYEVSRSLAACQGTILLVDACQGIQAQTVANFYLAFTLGLKILPVLNKIDLPASDPKKVMEQMMTAFEIGENSIEISAKTGINVDTLLPHIIDNIPAPTACRDKPFRALLFDSWYDSYVGVICLVAIGDGKVQKGDKITSAHTGLVYEVTGIGFQHPDQYPTQSLHAGQVGYLILGMKTTRDAFIGDTFYHSSTNRSAIELYPNFENVKSMVFSGLYPVDPKDYQKLADSLDRLTCNDSSVSVTKESSVALGQGFRIGFLGRLHLDVFRQRLEEEHSAAVINTAPTVPYKLRYKKSEELVQIKNPAHFPELEELSNVKEFLEPMVTATLIFPSSYLGTMIDLCENHRGEQLECNFLDESRVLIKYLLPLAEILTDFHDQLKSRTAGYASFDYEETGYQVSDLVKVNFFLNGKPVDALASVMHRSQSERMAKNGVKKLKAIMERDLFEIVIQGAINGKIIYRESIKAMRKDVTSKCYGGDVSRKMKLLDKQKAGKKRMKQLAGGVSLPQEAFLEFLE